MGEWIFQDDFWDSAPIAINLSLAASGFPGAHPWDAGARQAFETLSSLGGGTNVPFQKICYKHLCEHAYPNNSEIIIYKRLQKLFEPFSLETIHINIYNYI